VDVPTVTAWATLAEAAAQIGTLVVIGGSVIAALVQLRHAQTGNQLQALLSLERDFREPQLQAALTYVQGRLPERLADPAYRRELERIGFIDPETHPEMIACNWFNEMGTLLRRGLVAEETFMDLFARLIAHSWKHLTPAIAVMRRHRGPGQYRDFEYLASRAALWLERQHHGSERDFARLPMPDQWASEDAPQGVPSTVK
jgi:hypothetical protein